MEELFSCRNCIHNAAQSLNIGRGVGYCLKHQSVLPSPEQTTCKYIHRKDFPRFIVEEGVREHAAEFATFSGIAFLSTHKSQPVVHYSELYAWQHNAFDPLTHALAQYWKTKPSWVFVQAFSGGLDGRRSIAHSGLVRRYMDKCGTWRSSYRIVLALLKELPTEPHFAKLDLKSADEEDASTEALWDVLFSRIATIQEYGFHAGLESLMWATDQLNGGLSKLDWSLLQPELEEKQPKWTDLIVEHASREGIFFPTEETIPADMEDPEAL